MSTPSHETVWLSRTAQDQLRAELDTLTQSAEGARSDSDEARIRELRDVLRRAVVEDKPDDGLVEPGMVITVTFDGDDDPTTFLLAQRGIAAYGPNVEVDVYSPTSPLGVAITGKYAGDEFRYTSPTGAAVAGRINKVEPFRG